MKKLVPALLFSVLAATGCAKDAFVVLQLEDPDGLAADATTLVYFAGERRVSEVPLGGETFPVTETLVADDGDEYELWIDAVSAADAVLARAHVSLTFDEAVVGAATAVFGLPCEAAADCDDGTWCNGSEVCTDRICGSGEEACPASPFGCVDVACLEDADACEVTPAHERCEPLEDPESGQLERTYCDTRLGCVPGDACDVEGAECPRISECEWGRVCVSGRCVPQIPVVIDDGNPCTIDYCDETTGVENVDNPAMRGRECPLAAPGEFGICLDAACVPSRCGDGFTDAPGEECDDGDRNSDDVPNACRTNCLLPACGDGVADADEPCDDGDADDGDHCLVGCVRNVCGDGFVNLEDGAEQCDEGAANSENGACLPNCVLNVCRDGRVRLGVEACDDGDSNNLNGCDNDCDQIAWSVDLQSPIASGVAPIGLVRYVEGVLSGVVIVGTVDGTLHGLSPSDGGELWTLSTGGPAIESTAMITSGTPPYVVVMDVAGNVHGFNVLSGPAGGSWTYSMGQPSSAISLTSQNGGIIAIDDTGTLHPIRPDGTAGAFQADTPPPNLGVCDRCAVTVTNNFGLVGGMIVPLGNRVAVLDMQQLSPAPCSVLYFDLRPSERVVGHVAFVGDSDGQVTLQDKAYLTTTERIIQGSFVRGGSGCSPVGELILDAVLELTAPGATAPVILGGGSGSPADTRAIIFGGGDGYVYRFKGVTGQPTSLARQWDYDLGSATGVTAAATPTIDGTSVYVGGSDSRLHKIQLDGTGEWIVELDAPLSGSPLVAEGLVFATTTSGQVHAIVRGGGGPSGTQPWWWRSGGDDLGRSTGVTCATSGEGLPAGAAVIALFGLVLFARRRRSM